MHIPRRIAVPAALILLAATAGAQETTRSLSLTLEECLVRALRNNLSIQVAVLTPQGSALSVQKAREKFLPNFSFGLTKRNSSSPSFSWLESQDETLTKYGNYSAQITEVIPLGGTVTLGVSSAMTDTNQTGTTINPRYNSQLQLSFSQPLLRNFGLKMTQMEIVIAGTTWMSPRSSFIKPSRYDLQRHPVLLESRVQHRKPQGPAQVARELARDFLAKNQRSVEIGTLAPMDILAAESEVATREAGILAAEAAVKANEDQMKNSSI